MSRFDQGYICAMSFIVDGHGQEQIAKEGLLANGVISRKVAKAMGADPHDLEILNELLVEIEEDQKRITPTAEARG